MELYANILFLGGIMIGLGTCLFVAAAIMAMVLLDE